MKKIDIIIISIILVLALWAAFLPNRTWVYHEISPKELFYELAKKEKYWTTEDVAQAIIDKRADIILIDVRKKEEFQKFSLPNAINIPLDSLLFNTDNLLHAEGYKKILFSNGTSLAEKAWLLAKRANIEDVYVMYGGLNAWFDNILNPKPPQHPMSFEQQKLYERRLGLSAYFVGISKTPLQSVPQQGPAVIPVKQKKTTGLGGCG